MMASCTADFEEINQNPKAITFDASTPEPLMVNAIWGIAGNFLNGDNAGLLISHQVAEEQYANASIYNIQPDNLGSNWADIYINLRRLKEVRQSLDQQKEKFPESFTEGKYEAYEGVIAVMEVLLWHTATDIFGAMPYEQALDITNIRPAYSTQKEIYLGLFERLDTAIGALQAAEAVNVYGSSDLIYGGDNTLWLRFANSLKLRMAVRISDTEEAALAKTKAQEAVSAGVMQSNADNARFPYVPASQMNPIYSKRLNRSDVFPSDILVNQLVAFNDPRLSAYVEQGSSGYVGAQFGIANNFDEQYADFSSDIIAGAGDFPGFVMDYAEVAFLLAEAAHKNMISGDVQAYYEAGVNASVESWTGADAAAYLAEADVAFDAANAEEQIALQKWLSLYLNGWEAWAEQRRTGIPTPIPSINGLNYPLRLVYPTSETTLNAENYQAAVDQTLGGKDQQDVALWWVQ
ncbi:SusD/RagB family nutrient-binding outer membrane lipoprotein [Algivirga pacifica]|uniref:SusD/RagB family nutrient-binding outer membrane lipoprotein n=2 Tax=Algivirga pacifica TaxID=1162670 RepID=A0ABP9D740_9BACT